MKKRKVFLKDIIAQSPEKEYGQLYVKEPDYGDVSEKLDFKLHPLLHTTYYRKQLRIQILKNVYN